MYIYYILSDVKIHESDDQTGKINNQKIATSNRNKILQGIRNNAVRKFVSICIDITAGTV